MINPITAEEPFTPPDFEFQGVKFTWSDDEDYEPVDPPYEDLLVYVQLNWIELEPNTPQDPKALIVDGYLAEYHARVCTLQDIESKEPDVYEYFTGKGISQVPQKALQLAIRDLANLVEAQAKRIASYAERIKTRSCSNIWLPVGDPPAWNPKTHC